MAIEEGAYRVLYDPLEGGSFSVGAEFFRLDVEVMLTKRSLIEGTRLRELASGKAYEVQVTGRRGKLGLVEVTEVEEKDE